MVRTARVTGRICQIGVQQRSGEIYIEPKEKFVASGAIGTISHIDAVWHSGVPGPLPKEPAVKPPDLDWIRFLGPVRYRDWVPGQYLNFRAFLDFNGGKTDRLRTPLDGRGPHVHGRAGAPFRRLRRRHLLQPE